MMAMAALMAAACSHDSDNGPEGGGDVPVVETGKAISFNGQQGEEQVTRAATPLNEAGVTLFTVYGYKNDSYTDGEGFGGLQTVFPGYSVNWTASSAGTTTTNSNGWEYVNQQSDSEPEQTIKYWDWGTQAYRFFAVTAGATPGGETDESPRTFTMAADCSGADHEAVAANIAAMPYFTDLWFSTGNTVNYPTREFGKPVQLVFMKPYTKVRFMYTFVFPREGIMMQDQSFKPTDGSKIARKGTVKVSYPLTGKATRESYTITPATGEGSEELTELTEDCDPENDSKTYTVADANGWYNVLPNITQGSYTLSVKINGADKSCTVPAEFMQWLPGYSYTYVFKINDEGGVEIATVQSAYTPWSEMEGTHPVFNW